MEEIVELAMEAPVAHLPASPNKLQEYQEAQNVDPLCSIAIKYCREGWPKNRPDEALAPYWEARGSITLQGDLLILREPNRCACIYATDNTNKTPPRTSRYRKVPTKSSNFGVVARVINTD